MVLIRPATWFHFSVIFMELWFTGRMLVNYSKITYEPV